MESSTGVPIALGVLGLLMVGGGVLLATRKSGGLIALDEPFVSTYQLPPDGYDYGKFDVAEGPQVKIQFPVTDESDLRPDIEYILAKNPPGKTSLAAVTKKLAAIGAKFVPWDGEDEPGIGDYTDPPRGPFVVNRSDASDVIAEDSKFGTLAQLEAALRRASRHLKTHPTNSDGNDRDRVAIQVDDGDGQRVYLSVTDAEVPDLIQAWHRARTS